MRERREEEINLPEALIYEAFLERMDEEVNLQAAKAAQLTQKVEETREDLLRASKRKKIVEKLKERKKAEYASEVRRFEQGISDAASINRFNRKVGEKR